MGVPAEEIRLVRSQTDLVALIGEHVALRKQGQRWVGLCPFHSEKTPSFSVNAEEGVYYCFGCQKSGDAITFVRETEHLDFLDAVRRLADRAGVELHEDGAAGGGWRDRAVLYEAVARAVDWYHDRLLKAPDAGRARAYLRSRDYDPETVATFQLGWAPDEWDALVRALGLSAEVATASGLGFVNRGGRLQDALRNRVLFPIFESGGRPIALGGRILPPREGEVPVRPEPKYKNTQETPIYHKRQTLYGLNWAKRDVVAANEVIVCEGYTDVIAFFRAGLPRAVATCGTALAEDHFRQLRNFATRIVLAYDGDAAGQHGAESVYQWERDNKVAIAVARLPAGTDPAEVGREHPEALAAAIHDAVPFLQFRLDAALEGADLRNPEGRAAAAGRALDVVAEHPNDLVRDQYLMQVADRCGLDPALVRADAQRRGRTPGRSSPAPAATSARRVVDEDRPGTEALRLVLHAPAAIAERLSPVLFTDPLQRRAFETLLESADHAGAVDLALERGDVEVADLLRRLLVEEPSMPPDGDAVTPVVAQLVRHAARRVLDVRLHALREGSLGAKEAEEEISLAKDLLEQLEGPGGLEAERELVEWLDEEQRVDAAP